MSPLTIILIVVGLVLVGALGTCAAGVFWVKREATKLETEIAEGGAVIVMVSPPSVKEALAGPKKDYVGHWHSKSGSTLDIYPDGAMRFEKDEDGDGVKEKTEAPIAAFNGDDFEVKALVVITTHVTEPPHQVGGKWQMTADGVHLTR
jgi:hypothetical protein